MNGGTIYNSANTGPVSSAATDSSAKTGGIAGYLFYTTAENCYNSGSVTAAGGEAGSFAGRSSESTVSSCHWLAGSAANAFGDGSAGCAPFTTAEIASLRVSLNEWVTAQTEGGWLTWVTDSTENGGLPFLMDGVETGIVSLTRKDGSAALKTLFAGDGKKNLILAVYDANGKMLRAAVRSESFAANTTDYWTPSLTFSTTDTVKAFILNTELTPIIMN